MGRRSTVSLQGSLTRSTAGAPTPLLRYHRVGIVGLRGWRGVGIGFRKVGLRLRLGIGAGVRHHGAHDRPQRLARRLAQNDFALAAIAAPQALFAEMVVACIFGATRADARRLFTADTARKWHSLF